MASTIMLMYFMRTSDHSVKMVRDFKEYKDGFSESTLLVKYVDTRAETHLSTGNYSDRLIDSSFQWGSCGFCANHLLVPASPI